MTQKTINIKLLVGLFFAYQLFASIAQSLGYVAGDTYFLANVGAQYFPQILIVAAIISMAVTSIYPYISYRFDPMRLAMTWGTISMIILFAIWVVDIKFFYSFFYVVVELLFVIIGMQLWLIISDYFDPIMAKKYLGIILSAGASGKVLMALLTPFIITMFGTKSFPLVTGLLILPMLLIIYIISIVFKSAQKHTGSSKVQEPKSTQKMGFVQLLKNPFLFSIIVMTISNIIIYFIIMYQFKAVVAETYSEAQMAVVFSTATGILGAIGFILQIFVIRPVFMKFGMIVCLFVMPVITVLSGLSFLSAPFAMVGIVCYIAYAAIRNSIQKAAREMLWLPLKPSEQQYAKPLITGSFTALGNILAGLILSAFVPIMSVQMLSLLVLAIIPYGTWHVIKIKRRYISELMKAISRRQFDFNMLSDALQDKTTVSSLQKAYEMGTHQQKYYILDLIKSYPAEHFEPMLRKAMLKDDQEIQKYLIKTYQDNKNILTNDLLITLMQGDGLNIVSEAMLIAGSRVDTRFNSLLRSYIEDKNIKLRVASIVGLYMTTQGKDADIMSKLSELKNSRDSEVIIELIEAADFCPKLISVKERVAYLQANDIKLQKAVLINIRHEPRLAYLEAVLHCIFVPELNHYAVKTLKSFKPHQVSKLINQGIKSYSKNQDRCCLLIVLAQYYPNKHLADTLILLFKNAEYRLVAIQSIYKMVKIGMVLSSKQRTLISQEFDLECDRIFTLCDLHLKSKKGHSDLVQEHLSRKLQNSIHIALYLLLSPHRDVDFQSVLLGIDSEDRKRKNNTQEILDTLVPAKYRATLIPIIFDMADSALVAKIKNQFPNTKFVSLSKVLINWVKTKEALWQTYIALDDLIATGTTIQLNALPWHKVLALPMCGEILYKAYSTYPEKMNTITALSGYKLINRESNMLPLLEKIIFLKGVDIFKNIPSEHVSYIADIVDETQLKPNEVLFEKGDEGDAMYILVNGKIEVVDGSHTIAVLGASDVIGEMALLDKMPRSASAKAIEDCLLLKINAYSFEELLNTQPGITKNIIQVLTHRLRQAI